MRVARTITNAVNMHRGTTFNDPDGTVTLNGIPDIQPVNCCRVHSTLKTTPAVVARLTDHVWSVAELLERAAQVS